MALRQLLSAVMNFAVTVRTKSRGIFGRVLSAISKRLPVVNLKKGSSVRPSYERRVFSASLAEAIRTIENRDYDIGISAVMV
jgi:hypothetical protein